jgi:hypothetical protein
LKKLDLETFALGEAFELEGAAKGVQSFARLADGFVALTSEALFVLDASGARTSTYLFARTAQPGDILFPHRVALTEAGPVVLDVETGALTPFELR